MKYFRRNYECNCLCIKEKKTNKMKIIISFPLDIIYFLRRMIFYILSQNEWTRAQIAECRGKLKRCLLGKFLPTKICFINKFLPTLATRNCNYFTKSSFSLENQIIIQMILRTLWMFFCVES